MYTIEVSVQFFDPMAFMKCENKGEVLLSCQTSGRKVVSYRLLHRKYVFNKLRLEYKIYIGYVLTPSAGSDPFDSLVFAYKLCLFIDSKGNGKYIVFEALLTSISIWGLLDNSFSYVFDLQMC
jgi:hypothetical protein